MKPEQEVVYTHQMQARLGSIILAARDDALIGLWFDRQKHFKGIDPAWVASDTHPVLLDASDQLQEYFAGKRRHFDLRLKPDGTPFQQRVWQALSSIPFGRLISYGQLARKLNAERGVRAVAAAIGRNPVSIIVPCHRVIAANGALTGYAGGLERKRALLQLEEALHESQ